ncbi:MAG: hypothetical protein S0880_01685 [Actinomycetota bacterium]|nr:hypothetical protein [Actinomycetota bacterium]
MIGAVRSTDRFVGEADEPRQVVEVELVAPPDARAGEVSVTVRGVGVEPAAVTAHHGGYGSRSVVEVGVRTDRSVGCVVPVEATVAGTCGAIESRAGELVVAEPGWTIHLVSHFHFDAVWWNTQAASVSELEHSDWSASPRMRFQRSAFDTLDAHLALASADPDYRFCVAEVDYLAPYLDAVPTARPLLRQLVAEGRLDVVGGTHNEPSTNLTGLELTRRNLVAGLGFQRGVLGARVATAWQLDVFGHDPSFPSVLADAGVGASCWARGPYHHWGPMMADGFSRPAPPEGMQLDTEFDWIGPDGRGVLTSYLANHYSSAYALDECESWQEAADLVLSWAAMLRPHTASRNVVLTVGTDLSAPARWITELPRRAAQRWCWPRIECSTPTRFLDAVRGHLVSGGTGSGGAASGGRGAPLPQSRDMNPVYTGKDVSYIDTKQAHRAGEQLVGEAEMWATLASVLTGAPYPDAALEEAWRLLIYGAHHDAVTGTESDQVYLDLLAGWRRAHDLAAGVRDDATRELAATIDTRGNGAAVVVFNPVARTRTDVVAVTLDADAAQAMAPAGGFGVVDEHGHAVASVAEHLDGGGARVRFVAPDVPGIGHRTFRLVPAPARSAWTTERATAPGSGAVEIANDHHRLRFDPARGGCMSSWVEVASGRERIAEGDVGNELLLYPEYPTHPLHGEGPWHLSPSGPPERSSEQPATVTVERSAAGERVVVEGPIGDGRHVTTVALWAGVDRVDVEVAVHGLGGSDHLLRLRWPCPVHGSMPVAEVGEAAVGRGFGLIEVDAAEHPWTLDSPAHRWCASSRTAAVRLVPEPAGHGGGSDGGADVVATTRAIGCAEVIVGGHGTEDAARSLVAALARSGVTATTTRADGPRYGNLALDSNLPDVRIAIGCGASNRFAERVLAASPPHRGTTAASLDRRGAARAWIPAAAPLRDIWRAGADLRSDDALPVLAIVGADPAALAAEVDAIVTELDRDHTITAADPAPGGAGADPSVEDRTVAVINRGTPGFAIDAGGAIHVSLLRASTAWPSGQWIDPPRRTMPDGSGFGLQHWSHRFELSLVARDGDWRRADIAGEAAAVARPLLARLEPAHDGPRPAAERPVAVEPASVEVVALKAAGHPLADGYRSPRPQVDAVTVRCSEVLGEATDVAVHLPVDIAAVAATTLTEGEDGVRGDEVADPADTADETVEAGAIVEAGAAVEGAELVDNRAVRSRLGGFGGVTLVANLRSPIEAAATPANGAGTEAPAAALVPTFSRYWVQNRGPARGGVAALAVHLHLPADRRNPLPGRWSATVASNTIDDVLVARLDLTAPPGWRARPERRRVTVAPGGHVVVPLDVRPFDGATGLMSGTAVDVLRVVARVDGTAALDAYDERVVTRTTTIDHVVDVITSPSTVEVTPGGSGLVAATLHNRAAIELWGEIEALGPWGSWALVPGAVPLVLPPAEETEVHVPVTAPPDADPGVWWVLVRAVFGPTVRYSAAAPLVVIERGSSTNWS